MSFRGGRWLEEAQADQLSFLPLTVTLRSNLSSATPPVQRLNPQKAGVLLRSLSAMSATEDEANLDPYAALGLTPTATDKEIKSAYRKVSLKCHPDRVRRRLAYAKCLARC